MNIKFTLSAVLVLGLAFPCLADDQTDEKPKDKPVALEFLKASVGVWDAEIEVWSAGLDSPSTKFKGVETNRPYGEYWIASDFDSVYMGQTIKVHSIVGYDLKKKQLVGTIVDHGPYKATMTGEYTVTSKTVQWETEAYDLEGKLLVQKTSITQVSDDERLLVLEVPDKLKESFIKCMEIKYRRRKY